MPPALGRGKWHTSMGLFVWRGNAVSRRVATNDDGWRGRHEVVAEFVDPPVRLRFVDAAAKGIPDVELFCVFARSTLDEDVESHGTSDENGELVPRWPRWPTARVLRWRVRWGSRTGDFTLERAKAVLGGVFQIVLTPEAFAPFAPVSMRVLDARTRSPVPGVRFRVFGSWGSATGAMNTAKLLLTGRVPKDGRVGWHVLVPPGDSGVFYLSGWAADVPGSKVPVQQSQSSLRVSAGPDGVLPPALLERKPDEPAHGVWIVLGSREDVLVPATQLGVLQLRKGGEITTSTFLRPSDTSVSLADGRTAWFMRYWFTVPESSQSFDRVRLSARTQDHRFLSGEFTKEEIVDARWGRRALELSAGPTTHAELRVRAPNGAPLAGAVVTAMHGAATAAESRAMTQQARSTADGRVWLSGLDVNRIYDIGFANPETGDAAILRGWRPGAAADVTLSPSAPVEFSATDESNRPVAGAAIRFEPVRPGLLPRFSARTNARGGVELKRPLVPALYMVSARKRRARSERRPLQTVLASGELVLRNPCGVLVETRDKFLLACSLATLIAATAWLATWIGAEAAPRDEVGAALRTDPEGYLRWTSSTPVRANALGEDFDPSADAGAATGRGEGAIRFRFLVGEQPSARFSVVAEPVRFREAGWLALAHRVERTNDGALATSLRPGCYRVHALDDAGRVAMRMVTVRGETDNGEVGLEADAVRSVPVRWHGPDAERVASCLVAGPHPALFMRVNLDQESLRSRRVTVPVSVRPETRLLLLDRSGRVLQIAALPVATERVSVACPRREASTAPVARGPRRSTARPTANGCGPGSHSTATIARRRETVACSSGTPRAPPLTSPTVSPPPCACSPSRRVFAKGPNGGRGPACGSTSRSRRRWPESRRLACSRPRSLTRAGARAGAHRQASTRDSMRKDRELPGRR